MVKTHKEPMFECEYCHQIFALEVDAFECETLHKYRAVEFQADASPVEIETETVLVRQEPKEVIMKVTDGECSVCGELARYECPTCHKSLCQQCAELPCEDDHEVP